MGVTACGVDVACEASSHQVTPLAPNVCTTPAAPSPLPMPYPLMGDTGSLDPGCEDTQIEGKKAMNTQSKTARVSGNEPGSLKDIITLMTDGHAFALVGAPVVMFEGAMVVITGSPGFANSM